MIDVKLLSGALGAEISGIDLTDVSDENFKIIRVPFFLFEFTGVVVDLTLKTKGALLAAPTGTVRQENNTLKVGTQCGEQPILQCAPGRLSI